MRDDADGFAVVVNHFKSKGSGADDGTGQGLANPDRIAQAQALNTFANDFAADAGVDAVFLTGDFNAYSEEDPVQVLTDDPTTPWTNLESTDDPEEESYSFDGSSGSLDHVFANAAADDAGHRRRHLGDQRQRDGVQPVQPLQLRRHDCSTTTGRSAPRTTTRRSSASTCPTWSRRRGTSRSWAPTTSTAGLQRDGAGPRPVRRCSRVRSSSSATANPDTVFAAAGDLIGASTFESFIAKDKPTIDALNEAGLEVSAVGNHELDKGYDDLVNRVMAPYDPVDNPFGGAEWQYISANLRMNDDDSHAVPPSWTKTFGDVEVGFVGAVTEHLPELVSPGGISDIHVTDIVD